MKSGTYTRSVGGPAALAKFPPSNPLLRNGVNQALATINGRYCFEGWEAEEARKCTPIEVVEIALG